MIDRFLEWFIGVVITILLLGEIGLMLMVIVSTHPPLLLVLWGWGMIGLCICIGCGLIRYAWDCRNDRKSSRKPRV